MTELSGSTPITDIPFQQRLESFARENETFKEVFGSGIDQHISKLRRSAQVDSMEIPDVNAAVRNFLEIKKAISTGFEGYEFRSFSGSPRSTSIALNFARSEDLNPEDPSKLDLSNGQKKEEFEVIIGRLIDPSSFSNNPEAVITGRGVHLEVSKKSLSYNPRVERILIEKHDGFSFNITVNGDCTGKATKHDGILPYDSRGIYKVHSNSTSDLLREAAKLGL